MSAEHQTGEPQIRKLIDWDINTGSGNVDEITNKCCFALGKYWAPGGREGGFLLRPSLCVPPLDSWAPQLPAVGGDVGFWCGFTSDLFAETIMSCFHLLSSESYEEREPAACRRWTVGLFFITKSLKSVDVLKTSKTSIVVGFGFIFFQVIFI